MESLEYTPSRVCQTCSGRVSKAFARTFGDRDHTVHRCQNCDTRGRIKRGSAAGIEVPDPDPLDFPERMPDAPVIPEGQRSPGVSQ